MPNGNEENEVILADPSWMEDGLGIIGEQPDFVDEDLSQWDTNCYTESGDITPEDFIGAGSSCMATAGPPPATGTHLLGSIGGVCQWIDTTTC